ncbi:unnamed protein product [Calypogeia fissa]
MSSTMTDGEEDEGPREFSPTYQCTSCGHYGEEKDCCPDKSWKKRLGHGVEETYQHYRSLIDVEKDESTPSSQRVCRACMHVGHWMKCCPYEERNFWVMRGRPGDMPEVGDKPTCHHKLCVMGEKWMTHVHEYSVEEEEKLCRHYCETLGGPPNIDDIMVRSSKRFIKRYQESNGQLGKRVFIPPTLDEVEVNLVLEKEAMAEIEPEIS